MPPCAQPLPAPPSHSLPAVLRMHPTADPYIYRTVPLLPTPSALYALSIALSHFLPSFVCPLLSYSVLHTTTVNALIYLPPFILILILIHPLRSF